MSISLFLMLAITFLYAGYNLFIKISSNHLPTDLASTLLAAVVLQVTALTVSCVLIAGLLIRGETIASLPLQAYSWAVLAGMCIGLAEVSYFFLFRGFGETPPMPATIAIPFIVSGTIVVAVIFAWLALKEPLSWQKLIGMILIAAGVATMYINHKPAGLAG